MWPRRCVRCVRRVRSEGRRGGRRVGGWGRRVGRCVRRGGVSAARGDVDLRRIAGRRPCEAAEARETAGVEGAPGGDVAAAHAGYAAALARNPWLDEQPLALRAVVPTSLAYGFLTIAARDGG